MSAARCELCGRTPKRGTTEHHLIPRSCHANKWFKNRFTRAEMLVTLPLCRECHGAIHQLVPDEKELGRHLNTRALLLAHPAIARHVAWAKKQK